LKGTSANRKLKRPDEEKKKWHTQGVSKRKEKAQSSEGNGVQDESKRCGR
jgi:hypothetical protein